ncbi:MAG TPA: endonuclease/exonuclease/phosphatase family protein [Rhodopila sp.]|jgi:endonuclease/exonuclease/phosphatase (EEP) superfamily protein YafD|nr:endonuclease/exonuclease/phosphatase family protein [Rhodopila sp.]
MTKIISWNLLRLKGAKLHDVASLIDREQPDLLLMQEATHEIDRLPDIIGGHYARAPLPGCIHGVAMWTPQRLRADPMVLPLPAGAVVRRVCQIIDFGAFGVANVHLSHGQVLNRRQLRNIARALPHRAAVVGDFNLLGPALLPGFQDVGPRQPTHVMGDLVPLRIDRCLARGLICSGRRVLPPSASDHRAIEVRLSVPEEIRLAA